MMAVSSAEEHVKSRAYLYASPRLLYELLSPGRLSVMRVLFHWESKTTGRDFLINTQLQRAAEDSTHTHTHTHTQRRVLRPQAQFTLISWHIHQEDRSRQYTHTLARQRSVSRN